MSIESPVRQLDEIIDAGAWLMREAVEAAIEKHGKLDFLGSPQVDYYYFDHFDVHMKTLTLENGDVIQAEEVSENNGLYSATFDLAKYEAERAAQWDAGRLDGYAALEWMSDRNFANDTRIMSPEDARRAASIRAYQGTPSKYEAGRGGIFNNCTFKEQ